MDTSLQNNAIYIYRSKNVKTKKLQYVKLHYIQSGTKRGQGLEWFGIRDNLVSQETL